MEGKWLGFVSSFVFLLSPSLAISQEVNSVPFKDISSPNAIRATFVNAVKDVIKNTSKISVDLEWDLLPDSDSLRAAVVGKEAKVYKIKIPNKHLGGYSNNDEKMNWIDDINNQDAKEALKKALCANSSMKLETKSELEKECALNFQSQWDIKYDENKKPILENSAGKFVVPNEQNGQIKPSQYFGILRDQAVLFALLTSKGIGYSVDIEGAKPLNKVPFLSDGQDIHWDINLYEFKNNDSNNYPSNNHYRVTIKAVIEKPVRLIFPISTTQNVVLKTRIILKGAGFEGVLTKALSPDKLAVELTPSAQVPFDALVSNRSTVALDTAFQLIGNATLGGVASQGLLGGANDLSIVSGGLISGDKIEPIIGANLGLARLGNDASAGVLFGVGTDQTLYLGPSFQLSAFTISGGLRVFDDVKDVKFDAGGVISIDVSRLISGRRDAKPLEINPSNTGGNWGVASDTISQNLALVSWKVDFTNVKEEEDRKITFIQMCDAARHPLEENQRSIFTIDKTIETRFIPRGTYAVSYPLGYVLTSSGASNGSSRDTLGFSPQGSPRPYREDQFYSDTFKLTQKQSDLSKSTFNKIPILKISNEFMVLDRVKNDQFSAGKEVVIWRQENFSNNPEDLMPIGTIKIISVDDIRAVAIPVLGKKNFTTEDFAKAEKQPPAERNYCKTE